jgi:SET domain-containing protein
MNANNLNNVNDYLKEKISNLETKRRNKNIRDLYRGINEFKTLVKDENGDLHADSQNILNNGRITILSATECTWTWR